MKLLKLARINNTALFVACVTLSGAFLVTAGVATKVALTGETGTVSKAEKACTDTIKSLGFNPKKKNDGSLSVSILTDKNIEPLVNKTGVIMASCPSYTLYDYCAGAGCTKSGVSFTLNPNKE
ncbi:hypothetical protein [Comamonas thiooxydans]|uniref:hypothetical protein n=1 Tax=Comamonas thiooxydans TaxID=363952 RepID=UPI000B409914|nr:hypothetical protein [Comamonas thiooxydans]